MASRPPSVSDCGLPGVQWCGADPPISKADYDALTETDYHDLTEAHE